MSETLDPVQFEQKRLIEEAAALQEMMETPGWAVFQAYAEQWRREHEQVILSGGMTDPLEYRFHTGRLQGINQLLDIPAVVERARLAAMLPDEQYVDELEALDQQAYPVTNPDEGA